MISNSHRIATPCRYILCGVTGASPTCADDANGNIGYGNTGKNNVGNYNSGNGNNGNYNAGDSNVGMCLVATFDCILLRQSFEIYENILVLV